MPSKGAAFRYLVGQRLRPANGQAALHAYGDQELRGGPIGFIGLTSKETPTIVDAVGVAGLSSCDEAETANQLRPAS